jgi:hypothetical protein
MSCSLLITGINESPSTSSCCCFVMLSSCAFVERLLLPSTKGPQQDLTTASASINAASDYYLSRHPTENTSSDFGVTSPIAVNCFEGLGLSRDYCATVSCLPRLVVLHRSKKCMDAHTIA